MGHHRSLELKISRKVKSPAVGVVARKFCNLCKGAMIFEVASYFWVLWRCR